MQDEGVDDIIYGVEELVAYASRVVELQRRRPPAHRLARRQRRAPRQALACDPATSWRARSPASACSATAAWRHEPRRRPRPRAPQAYIDLVPAPGGNLPKPPVVTAEQLLAMMERYAIDAAVSRPGRPARSSATRARPTRSRAWPTRRSPPRSRANRDRFAGLALLPLPDVDAAIERARRTRSTPWRLDGVLLPRHVAGTYLGDPAWERCTPSSTGAAPTSSSTRRARQRRAARPSRRGCTSSRSTPPGRWRTSSTPGRSSATRTSAGRSRTSAARRRSSPTGSRRSPPASRTRPSRRRPARSTTSRACTTTPAWPTTSCATAATAMLRRPDHIVFGTDWPYLALPEEPGDPAPVSAPRRR